jgi:hypothetical protein
MINSRMRWVGHVERTGVIKIGIELWLEGLKGRDQSVVPEVDGRIM